MTTGIHSRFLLFAAAGLVTGAADAAPTLDDAIRVVGSARAAVAEIAVLTGTEDFNIEALRRSLRESRGEVPYEKFESAEAIIQFANSGATTVIQLVNFSIGWAALEVNWVYATLLGNTQASSRLLRESNRLVNYEVQYMVRVERGTGAFASVYTRMAANRHAMVLHRVASETNLIAVIPVAMDPAGFLRQRLQVMYNRLTNTAHFVNSAGEAFAVF